MGNDYYFDFINLDKTLIEPGLYLIDSKVGWIISGRHPVSNQTISFLADSFELVNDNKLFIKPDLALVKPESLDLGNLLDLESVGIRDDPKINQDELAIDKFNRSIKFLDGRYSVSLPWVSFAPDLRNNYTLSLGRLKSQSPSFLHMVAERGSWEEK